jgi:hypothetical protein
MRKEIAARGYFGVGLWSSYNWSKKQHDPGYSAALRGEPHQVVDEMLTRVVFPVIAHSQFCRVFRLDADTPKKFESVALQERK